jgi:acylphosphatase
MKVHKNIRVEGRVQGVFYRASTVDMAKSLGLNGFVLNEPSGAVYMEVEGEPDVVDQLIEWARKGPIMARVDTIDVTSGDVQNFTRFDIKR